MGILRVVEHPDKSKAGKTRQCIGQSSCSSHPCTLFHLQDWQILDTSQPGVPSFQELSHFAVLPTNNEGFVLCLLPPALGTSAGGAMTRLLRQIARTQKWLSCHPGAVHRKAQVGCIASLYYH
jgi:hypothetical protein